MCKKMFLTISVFAALVTAAPLRADSFLDRVEEVTRGASQKIQESQAAVPCPAGRQCVLVDSFTKAGYEAEAKTWQVGRLTEGRGWDRLVIEQHIGGSHGVIVNTVKVRQGGRWVPYTVGARLGEGRTELPVPVPAGAPEIVVSFDHGKGAEVKVILERNLP